MKSLVLAVVLGGGLGLSSVALACGGKPCGEGCAMHSAQAEVVNPFALADVSVKGASTDTGGSLTLSASSAESQQAIFAWADASSAGHHVAENVTVSVEKTENSATVSFVGNDATAIAWAQSLVGQKSGGAKSCPHAK